MLRTRFSGEISGGIVVDFAETILHFRETVVFSGCRIVIWPDISVGGFPDSAPVRENVRPGCWGSQKKIGSGAENRKRIGSRADNFKKIWIGC
jgi:hypothetical protein